MRRILAVLLAAMLGGGLGLFAAQPASANGAGYGCSDVGVSNVRVCLYDDQNNSVAGGFWQRDYLTVFGECVNLSRHVWNNGGSVNDQTSSAIITAGRVDYPTRFRVRFYNWVNCSSANGYQDAYVGSYGYTRLQAMNHDNWVGSIQIFPDSW